MHQIAQRGFNIIELMVVVSIIGLLSMLAIPNIRRTAELTEAVALANNVRVLTDAVELYGMSSGSYPGLWKSGNLPPEAVQNLPSTWEQSEFPWVIITAGNITYAIIDGLGLTTRQSLRIDQVLDDGNPASGDVRIIENDQLVYLIGQNSA